jgi:putative copper export protein
MLVIIPVVFYSYTAFTEEILLVDIITFMIAVVIGQFVSYKINKQSRGSRMLEIMAVAVITVLAVIFIIFTFYPPHLPLFMDSETGQYGIS